MCVCVCVQARVYVFHDCQEHPDLDDALAARRESELDSLGTCGILQPTTEAGRAGAAAQNHLLVDFTAVDGGANYSKRICRDLLPQYNINQVGGARRSGEATGPIDRQPARSEEVRVTRAPLAPAHNGYVEVTTG